MAVRKVETFPPVTMGHIRNHGCRDLPHPAGHERARGSRLHARDHGDWIRRDDRRVGVGAAEGLRALPRLRGARGAVGWLRVRVGARRDMN